MTDGIIYHISLSLYLSIYLGLLLVPFTLYYGFGCRRVSILGWGAVLNTMTDGIIYIIYLSIYLGFSSHLLYTTALAAGELAFYYLGLLLVPFTSYYGFGCRRVSNSRLGGRRLICCHALRCAHTWAMHPSINVQAPFLDQLILCSSLGTPPTPT